MPDSPEARARARAQRRGAIGELATGRHNWRLQTKGVRDALCGVGKSFKTLGSYAAELTKGMFGVGDAAKRMTLRLKAAAIGFNVMSFVAKTFVSRSYV